LKWYDLIPLVSFLTLGGKCRYCRGEISPQYPIIELVNGLFYLLSFYYFGLSLNFVFYSFLISILLVISIIDYREQIIPDGLVLTMLGSTIIYKALIYSFYTMNITLLDGILGFLIAGLFFLLITLVSNGGMGGGDIKLIAVLGLILGLKKVWLCILLAFVLGGIISIFLLAFKIKTRKDPIPFGPFIVLGFLMTVLFGDWFIYWYLNMFF